MLHSTTSLASIVTLIDITGAARTVNAQYYGFVLAGYTAAMVGLPALAHPEGAFMAAGRAGNRWPR